MTVIFNLFITVYLLNDEHQQLLALRERDKQLNPIMLHHHSQDGGLTIKEFKQPLTFHTKKVVRSRIECHEV